MHGGASATLAETIGSVAAALTVDTRQKRCVGLTLNVNHIRPIPEGQTEAVIPLTAAGKVLMLRYVWKKREEPV